MTKQRKPNGKCAVCSHPQVYEIETTIVSGVSLRAIGDKFGLHKDAVQRHGQSHMSAERRAQLVAGPLKPMELMQKAAEKSGSLLDRAELVSKVLMARFLAADACNDGNGANNAAGRLMDTMRFIASLTGDVQKASAVITNYTLIINSPFMADLQAMLAIRLAPYREAREAVLEGLQELSAKAMQGSPEVVPPSSRVLEHVSG